MTFHSCSVDSMFYYRIPWSSQDHWGSTSTLLASMVTMSCGALWSTPTWSRLFATLARVWTMSVERIDRTSGNIWNILLISRVHFQSSNSRITWANIDLSSKRSSDNHRRAISLGIPQPSTIKIRLKIIYLIFHTYLSGTNKIMLSLLTFSCFRLSAWVSANCCVSRGHSCDNLKC